MLFKYGTYSKKGHSGSGLKLHHSEYIKYIFGTEEYYYKVKYYTSAFDGDIKYKRIVESTFKKAKKRGEYTKVVIAYEEPKKMPREVLEHHKSIMKQKEG